MFCRHCGKEIIDECLYCNYCGANINENINESNIENHDEEDTRNRKEDKKEKHSDKKRFNLKIAIGGVVALAVIGVSIALFSVNSNPKTQQNGNTAGNINSGGIAVNKDEWIYYNCLDTIYKMKKDGSQQTVAIKSDNGYYENLNVVGDWIYCNYRDAFDSFSDKNSYDINRIYKMKPDGSEKTKVEEINDSHYEFLNVVGIGSIMLKSLNNIKCMKYIKLKQMEVEKQNSQVLVKVDI